MPTFIKLINLNILYFIFKISQFTYRDQKVGYKWTKNIQCQHGFATSLGIYFYFIGLFTFFKKILIGGFEMPYFIIVKLFFALFGLSSERDVNLTPENPDNIKYFQVYLYFG